MNIVDEIKRARRVGTPLIAVTTADQPTCISTLRRKGINGGAPLILWDVVRGYSPLNDAGREAVQSVLADSDPMAMTNIVEALAAALKFPEKSVILVSNAHRYLDEPAPMQAVMNLRDQFKSTGRTLVMLGVDFRLPAELTQDVLILDEPLPDDSAIEAILASLYEPNGVETTPELLERSKDALRGLAAFPIEQAASLSVRSRDGKQVAEVADMWERKRRMIQQVRGLTMETGGETFDDIGGLASVKEFAKRLFSGPRRPRVIVFIDEIEKAMAGAGTDGFGDSSGVSQDFLQVLLTEMEDRKYTGQIAVGPAGSGKSFYARTVAATYNVPLLRLDLGAAKGSLVGQSEAQIRAAMKAIRSIAGDAGALFVATCNRLDSLPPELRRRFRFGIYFFDLPDSDERKSIAAIHAKRYPGKLKPDFFAARDGWSGANIRDCCELAYAMSCTLEEASKRLVPAAQQDPQGLERLRNMAAGKFLSASYPGPYRLPDGSIPMAEPTIRRIGVIAEVEQPESPIKKGERGN